MRQMCLAVSLLLGAACAHAQNPPVAAPADSAAADSVAPRVYGRLNQSDIAIRLRNDELEIRFVPLDAGLLALLSEDAATALERLVARYRPAIDSAGRDAGISEPGLALVNFFGVKDGVRFDSQLLNIQARGQLLQPMAVVPLSPQFGSGQLDARESVMAIFLFRHSLPVWDPFRISERLPILQRERQRLHPASP